MDIEELARKYALKNAVDYEGECNPGAVIGKIMGEVEEADPQEVQETAGKVCGEINQLELEQQKEELEEYEFEGQKEDRDIPPLPGDTEEVVMRMAPFPSGNLHIGNARMAILNDEYVKRNDGKLLLVIDDTVGSEEKRPMEDAYEEIPEDLEWLGVEYEEVIYKSDRLEKYYEYAEKFLEEGWAYVCECRAEELRGKRENGIECDHRDRSPEENLEKWEKMVDGSLEEGEAAVRLKTDMQHKDPAFRDRVLLRISELDHPRVGKDYRVWPMLEFSWAIDDHLLGMTHILRGKDLVMEDKMEKFMWDLLDWDHPEIMHHGLLNIEGIKISTSEARRKIEDGEYRDWTDPRTWSLKSLKRRGIRPEAIRNFILSFGMSDTDIKVPVDNLYTENRKIIDEEADRYFFVENPVELEIHGVPEDLEPEIPRHPEDPGRGYREPEIEREGEVIKVLVEKEDLEDGFMRLKGLCNLRVDGNNAEYVEGDHTRAVERDAPIIHWVPTTSEEAKVVMPDASSKKGLVEPNEIEEDEVIQFERFGFVRCDSEDENRFYFTHS